MLFTNGKLFFFPISLTQTGGKIYSLPCLWYTNMYTITINEQSPQGFEILGDNNSSTVTKCKKNHHYENLYYSLKWVNTLNVKIMIHEDGSESWAFNDMLQTCYFLGTLIETAKIFYAVNRSVLEPGSTADNEFWASDMKRSLRTKCVLCIKCTVTPRWRWRQFTAAGLKIVSCFPGCTLKLNEIGILTLCPIEITFLSLAVEASSKSSK